MCLQLTPDARFLRTNWYTARQPLYRAARASLRTHTPARAQTRKKPSGPGRARIVCLYAFFGTEGYWKYTRVVLVRSGVTSEFNDVLRSVAQIRERAPGHNLLGLPTTA